MKKLQVIGLAATLSAISCNSMAAVTASDFYVKALGGVALGNVSSLNSVESGANSISSAITTSNSSNLFGAALGYSLKDSPFSFELQALRINKQNYNFSTFYPTGNYMEADTLQVRSNVLLLNLNYDLPSYKNFTPFIGGGIGIAHNKVNGSYRGSHDANWTGVWHDKSANNLAYDLTAGVAYQFNEHLGMSLAYQYLSLGKLQTADTNYDYQGSALQQLSANRFSTNNIMLGLSYKF